jgi:hypothetical protein
MMKWPCAGFALSSLVLLSPAPLPAEEVRQLQASFADYSGARLVFDAADLPEGRYHDIMLPLPEGRRIAAARIAVREVQKLPPGYLGAIGLKAVGLFAVCASRDGDGFRPYDASIKGYRYYGIWNGHDAIAAAFYTEGQLPLTFHHEVFHHVDATDHGRTDAARLYRDARFSDMLAGKNAYPAAWLDDNDLAALRRLDAGGVLEGAVSDYARKNVGEDKAETARYLMSHLPGALSQVATRPQMPGSQRLLHVLHKYAEAPAENGPGMDWFVNVALGRRSAPARSAAVTDTPPSPADIVGRLQKLAAAAKVNEEAARAALREAEKLTPAQLSAMNAAVASRAAARLVERLVRAIIHPRDGDRVFDVRGAEDAQGVNYVLRRDVREIGHSTACLRKISALAPATAEEIAVAQLKVLRLLARYERFIAAHWHVTDGTLEVFRAARDQIFGALPPAQAAAVKEKTGLTWTRLGERITAAGSLEAMAETTKPPHNPYLPKVDAAIANPGLREVIRRVQPACVRLGNGSGVNIAPEGFILTAGHCTSGVGSKISLSFPDGRAFTAVCTAFNAYLDLAICTIAGAHDLPFAPVAAEAPEVGDWVVCIGQPGGSTPRGKATGYKPFHVSTGHIRGFMDDPLGDQRLGRTKHDAWTYWGHSGSPLFNHEGAIVALHNSWDSTTAMRHAVTHQAIRHFLRREIVPFTVAK